MQIYPVANAHNHMIIFMYFIPHPIICILPADQKYHITQIIYLVQISAYQNVVLAANREKSSYYIIWCDIYKNIYDPR